MNNFFQKILALFFVPLLMGLFAAVSVLLLSENRLNYSIITENSLRTLFFLVLIEETIKLIVIFFWTKIFKEKVSDVFPFGFLFGLGFWLFEVGLISLRIDGQSIISWENFSLLYTLIVHISTTLLLAEASSKLISKNKHLAIFYFMLAVVFHFYYNYQAFIQ